MNWKTTLSGIGSLLMAVGSILHDPTNINKPEIWTAIITGIGLLFAADGKKT